MDHANTFDSTATYRLLRAEYAVALVIASVLFLWHVHDIRWAPAIFLFIYIDVIGYLPGAIAHHRARGRPIGRPYYVLYNVMHSFVTQSTVVGSWMLLVGVEWALLVVPIHLCGDRAIFGNFLKPFSVPFEPKKLPEFAAFQHALAGAADGRRASPSKPAPSVTTPTTVKGISS